MDKDDDTDRYWTQLIVSNDASTKKVSRSSWILTRAKRVLGAYRKDDFADPESFLAQMCVVLSRYDNKVIDQVCNPISGITSVCKFPPTLAEVREACDYNHTRNSRIDELSQFTYRAVERTRLPPGGAANLHIPRDNRDYNKYLAWAQHPDRDPREWKIEDGELWVGLGAMDQIRAKPKPSTWQPFTADQLLAIYPRPKIEGKQ